jgi:hypothetical protein
MKPTSAIALLVAITCQSVMSDPSSSSYSTFAATKAAPSLRGAGLAPLSLPIAAESGRFSSGAAGRHRGLQRPNEDCYTATDHDDTANPMWTPCTPAILGVCNNVPACAAAQPDAVTLGGMFCVTWTVWSTNDPTCPWQYMCCNPPTN